jgi:hypothetical protein
VSIGGAIRRLFGPYERQISEGYRSIYVDVDAYAASLRAWVPNPCRILEVGCGDGHLAFKEWERTSTPIHWLGYFSDRWITGDRISYMDGEEIRTRLRDVFGSDSIRAESRVRPWRNNISLLVRP